MLKCFFLTVAILAQFAALYIAALFHGRTRIVVAMSFRQKRHDQLDLPETRRAESYLSRVEDFMAAAESVYIPDLSSAPVDDLGSNGGNFRRLETHALKLTLWEEMLQSDFVSVDLTDASRLDWKQYIQSLSDETQELVCLGDTCRIRKFCGEIHATAHCPWTRRPAFHYVAYDEIDGLRAMR